MAETRPNARIELQLRSLNQLFHTLDPSPFRERSLDETAETFIASWARELPRRLPLELVVHIAEGAGGEDSEALVSTAVRNHFGYLAESKRREFGALMARGRASLAIGLAFLALCTLIGNMLPSGGGWALGSMLREGLLIGGWVAMWRPIEIFLYEWWAVRGEQREFERLSHMTVCVLSAHREDGREEQTAEEAKGRQAGRTHAGEPHRAAGRHLPQEGKGR